jgi:RNAse (barnase) inhibitor barstar
MATFRWPDDADRLDFRLLSESAVLLYFSREVLAKHLDWLRQHGYRVHAFDCSGWGGEENFHTAVSRSLEFSGYYGRNLNAFGDCLGTINIPEDGGTALVFLSFDAWFARSPAACWHVLDIIAIQSRSFLLTGRRLLALVHSEDREIGIKPVGAQPVNCHWTEGDGDT